MNFTETYDIEKVKWLFNQSSETIRSLFYNKFEVDADGNHEDFKTSEKMIRKLLLSVLLIWPFQRKYYLHVLEFNQTRIQ